MTIRNELKKDFYEKFGITYGGALEQYSYNKAYNYSLSRGYPLDWQCNSFKDVYYNICIEIIDTLKTTIDPKLAVYGDTTDRNPDMKQYIRTPTPLSKPKTMMKTCRRCSRNKPCAHFAKSAQLRAADEAKAIVYTCCECSYVSIE